MSNISKLYHAQVSALEVTPDISDLALRIEGSIREIKNLLAQNSKLLDVDLVDGVILFRGTVRYMLDDKMYEAWVTTTDEYLSVFFHDKSTYMPNGVPFEDASLLRDVPFNTIKNFAALFTRGDIQVATQSEPVELIYKSGYDHLEFKLRPAIE